MSPLILLSLLALNIPGSAQSFIAVILNFVFLDIFFSDAWLLNWFDFDPNNDQPLSPEFDELGFFSINLTANLGTGFLFLSIMILALAIHIFAALLGKCSDKFKGVLKYIDIKLKWNFYIRLFIYLFQPMLISSLINVQSLLYSTKIEAVSSVVSICFIPSSIIIFILITRELVRQPKTEVEKEQKEKQLDAIINNINHKSQFSMLNWNMITMIRQAIVIIILVVIKDYIAIQIMLLLLLSFFMQVLAICIKPFTETIGNVILFINEALITIYLYISILLTDFLFGSLGEYEIYIIIKIRDIIGWALLSIILLTAFINLTIFIYQQRKYVLRLRREIKMRLGKRSQVKFEDKMHHQNKTYMLSSEILSQLTTNENNDGNERSDLRDMSVKKSSQGIITFRNQNIEHQDFNSFTNSQKQQTQLVKNYIANYSVQFTHKITKDIGIEDDRYMNNLGYVNQQQKAQDMVNNFAHQDQEFCYNFSDYDQRQRPNEMPKIYQQHQQQNKNIFMQTPYIKQNELLQKQKENNYSKSSNDPRLEFNRQNPRVYQEINQQTFNNSQWQ